MNEETPDSAAPVPEETRSALRTRPTLLFRLRDWRDQATWREFYALYERYVYRYARGAGLNHHEAEDLVQDVFAKVADRIGDFESREQRGSFRRWLGNLVRWRIVDLRRRQQRRPGESHSVSAAPFDEMADAPPAEMWEGDSAEAERWETEWQQRVVDVAMSRLSRQVSPEHLQVFQLRHQKGWSLIRISRELGVGLANAYAINSRLTKRLKTEVERLSTELL
ncbi:RNA polymerase sigma factor [Actomonas aquatica]|uniref:Sigma-70 family RNA polymerase sigma factor n=1 Tax=Actomonas aquatica TaxID=2866162 RepID=A0ABZ1C3Y2_9BACT|nr:sigma-70 family RNA polymerase sigma factor [Opitutus sp. WL0086]WRQ86161.1 sigma-70 family RNA polymerase sigma factor [Opitutus sp. WL0086]